MSAFLPTPTVKEKLGILSTDAQYDLACACGPGADQGRVRSSDERWLYPATVQNGGTGMLFRTLASNVCTNDCLYCPLRVGMDAVRRCALAPEEIAGSFLPYWRAGKVFGLFLTSGVCGTPDATMERLVDTAEILRRRHAFRGYIHLKLIPGASDAAIDAALRVASAVSLNIETAGEAHFRRLTRRKDYVDGIVAPLRRVAALTAKGAPFERVKLTTQFVVGASDESDREIVRYTGALYDRLRLHRIFFSAYQRGLGDPGLPGERSAASNADMLAREHRLYQVDFMLRKYGFSADEIGYAPSGNLRLDIDPKEEWARRHPERYPVPLATAPREDLLRVPGLGPVAVRRILEARAAGVRLRIPEEAGIPPRFARRAAPYLR